MSNGIKPYIVADIEGATGTWCREDTLVGTRGWRSARRAMTEDINTAVEALCQASASSIIVKDFHRDGDNILPRLLDRRARLIRGYYFKPLLMYGDPGNSNRAFFMGMHGSSGTAGAFLPHTLTSRIAEITINGSPLCETQIFAHVLGESGIPVAFVSGCPEACEEARAHLPWIVTCAVPKKGTWSVDYAAAVRQDLAREVSAALLHKDIPLYRFTPPFHCIVTFRDEKTAGRGDRWGFRRHGRTVEIQRGTAMEMVTDLIRLAYFSPTVYRLLPVLLPPARLLMSLYDPFR